MSLPWGVKQAVDPEASETVKTFISGLVDQSVTLPSGNVINILKADVKERKGNFLMIMRYAITEIA